MIFEAICTTHRASRVQQRRSLNAIITNNQRGTVKNLRKQYGGNTMAISWEARKCFKRPNISTDAVDTEKIIKPATLTSVYGTHMYADIIVDIIDANLKYFTLLVLFLSAPRAFTINSSIKIAPTRTRVQQFIIFLKANARLSRFTWIPRFTLNPRSFRILCPSLLEYFSRLQSRCTTSLSVNFCITILLWNSSSLRIEFWLAERGVRHSKKLDCLSRIQPMNFAGAIGRARFRGTGRSRWSLENEVLVL